MFAVGHGTRVMDRLTSVPPYTLGVPLVVLAIIVLMVLLRRRTVPNRNMKHLPDHGRTPTDTGSRKCSICARPFGADVLT